MVLQQTILTVFSAFAVSAAAAAAAAGSSKNEVIFGGRTSSNTFLQVGKKMNVTTHLVKSPRSLWVIGRLTFLTNETLIEVNPAGILIMARPYGRPKTFAWSSSSSSSSLSSSSSSSSSSSPVAGHRGTLLFHDATQRLSVFLCPSKQRSGSRRRRRNSVKIVSETSEFLVDIKEEKGFDDGRRKGEKGVDGRRKGEKGLDDGRRSESFAFLGVRLATVSIESVDAAVDSLSTAAPSTPSATSEPATRAPTPRRPYTYFQEVVLFFRNIEGLIINGANYVRKTAANSYIATFVELYKPRHWGSRQPEYIL